MLALPEDVVGSDVKLLARREKPLQDQARHKNSDENEDEPPQCFADS